MATLIHWLAGSVTLSSCANPSYTRTPCTAPIWTPYLELSISRTSLRAWSTLPPLFLVAHFYLRSRPFYIYVEFVLNLLLKSLQYGASSNYQFVYSINYLYSCQVRYISGNLKVTSIFAFIFYAFCLHTAYFFVEYLCHFSASHEVDYPRSVSLVVLQHEPSFPLFSPHYIPSYRPLDIHADFSTFIKGS